MKKVIFKLNKKLDKHMIYMFIKHLKYRQGGIDFVGCVLGPNPKLKNVVKMNENKKKEEINRYVDEFYRKKQNILHKQIKEFNQRWSKLEKRYFKLIKNIFKLQKLPKRKYIGYLSIINCGPRFLEDKSFQAFYRRPKDSMYVAMHEILHFFFYDHVFKNYPRFKKLDPNRGILWDLAEIFNSVILAEPELKKIHEQRRNWSYPSHRKHIPKMRKYWRDDKDIDTWIERGFKYLK